MSYATPAELREQIDQTTADDTVLQAIIDAADQAINLMCNRPDGFLAGTAAARLYYGSGMPYMYLGNDEAATITKVEVKDSPTDTDYTEWTTSDWIAASGDPRTPNFNKTPYTLLIVDPTGDYDNFTSGTFTSQRGFRPDYDNLERNVPTVRVTGRWGYATTTPATVKQASILQAARWYKRIRAGGGDVLISPEFGLVQYRQSLDPDVKMMLVEARLVRPMVG